MHLQIDEAQGEYYVHDDRHLASGRGGTLREALMRWLQAWHETVSAQAMRQGEDIFVPGQMKPKDRPS